MSDELNSDLRDRLMAATRGAVSIVPTIGGPLAEILTAVIPNQRIDRIAAYVRALEQRVGAMERASRSPDLADPHRVDLIERGGYQAARALTEERIEQIVQVVANGLDSEAADAARHGRLLDLLGQIDDDEMLLLNAYGQMFGQAEEDAWAKVNRPEPTFMGSSNEAIDREALFELGKSRLLRLGLLERKFSSVKKGQLPDFDPKTGGFKGRVEISYLGRMLLRSAGMPASIDADE